MKVPDTFDWHYWVKEKDPKQKEMVHAEILRQEASTVIWGNGRSHMYWHMGVLRGSEQHLACPHPNWFSPDHGHHFWNAKSVLIFRYINAPVWTCLCGQNYLFHGYMEPTEFGLFPTLSKNNWKINNRNQTTKRWSAYDQRRSFALFQVDTRILFHLFLTLSLWGWCFKPLHFNANDDPPEHRKVARVSPAWYW